MSIMRDFFVSWFQDTPEFRQSFLASITPVAPAFYKPLTNRDLLLSWERILKPDSRESSAIRKQLSDIVKTNKRQIEDFDFGKIQSMSDSKGFVDSFVEAMNGNWYKDAKTWGSTMYHCSPLNNDIRNTVSGLDEQDFERNIAHIEKEGFSRESPLTIDYYAWLDRYVALQGGGSHHAAMAIYQMHDQHYTYKREANITEYSLDIELACSLKEEYYLFISARNAFCNHPKGFDGELKSLLHSAVSREVEQIRMYGSKSPSSLFAIPKSSLTIEQQEFEKWLNKNLRRGVIIDFVDMLENPMFYCTNHYDGDVGITVRGEPSLTNDKFVKYLKNNGLLEDLLVGYLDKK